MRSGRPGRDFRALSHPSRILQGKVRDVYALPDDQLLLVASDRVSAFDRVVDHQIRDKGRALTLQTAWWLAECFSDIPHHALSVDAKEIRERTRLDWPPWEEWSGRVTLARRTHPIPVECVVRGRVFGSVWREYQASGTIAGTPVPAGLRLGDPLDRPVFSPARKAQEGHDENVSFADVQAMTGAKVARELRDRSMELFELGRARARAGGLVLVDTKFEFGVARDGRILLIDEVLTADSSRFWLADEGARRRQLDKQPIRDYLALAQDDCEDGLPDKVAMAATHRYRRLFRTLTGCSLDAYVPPRLSSPTRGGAPQEERPSFSWSNTGWRCALSRELDSWTPREGRSGAP